MRFPPQFLDELRARLPVSDVVGRRVKLKTAGRKWRGLSRFNKARMPSFYVNDQKGDSGWRFKIPKPPVSALAKFGKAAYASAAET